MTKTPKSRFNPRPGYARVPGKARRYVRLSDDSEISRTQYIKETEGVTSLKAKAEMNRSKRQKYGIRANRSQSRYNAIVTQYKLTHGFDIDEYPMDEFDRASMYELVRKKSTARVRGNSPEAVEFKTQYEIFTRSTKRQDYKSEAAYDRARIEHIEAGQWLGIISEHYDPRKPGSS